MNSFASPKPETGHTADPGPGLIGPFDTEHRLIRECSDILPSCGTCGGMVITWGSWGVCVSSGMGTGPRCRPTTWGTQSARTQRQSYGCLPAWADPHTKGPAPTVTLAHCTQSHICRVSPNFLPQSRQPFPGLLQSCPALIDLYQPLQKDSLLVPLDSGLDILPVSMIGTNWKEMKIIGHCWFLGWTSSL